MNNINGKNRIRLLLVEDHEVVRSGLRMLLGAHPDIEIAGEASTAAEALQLANHLQPDIVLMDITLPDISGIEVTRLLRHSGTKARIIALTIHEDEQFFFEMLQAGASGYVPKRAASEDLISAIQMVHRGEIYIYPGLAKLLVNDYLLRSQGSTNEGQPTEELTSREQEILLAVAAGQTNDEIAEALFISRHTVARHRENVMRKLGLHSRSELVKYAIRKGLIKA